MLGRRRPLDTTRRREDAGPRAACRPLPARSASCWPSDRTACTQFRWARPARLDLQPGERRGRRRDRAGAGRAAVAAEAPRYTTRSGTMRHRGLRSPGTGRELGRLHRGTRASPHRRSKRPIVFDSRLARGRDDVVLAHLNHRLVQMCAAPAARRGLGPRRAAQTSHRVTARRFAPTALDTPVLVAHARLLVLGGDNTACTKS